MSKNGTLTKSQTAALKAIGKHGEKYRTYITRPPRSEQAKLAALIHRGRKHGLTMAQISDASGLSRATMYNCLNRLGEPLRT